MTCECGFGVSCFETNVLDLDVDDQVVKPVVVDVPDESEQRLVAAHRHPTTRQLNISGLRLIT